MWLPNETFKNVIQHTPLVAIDLIVENEHGEILLGKRINAPAQDDWFVPGGRIRKNETMDDAYNRLVREELGIESQYSRNDAKFLGVYEHFYENCVFGDDVDTHYIVLGYSLALSSRCNFESQQHSNSKWWKISDLLDSDRVNDFTKQYFQI